MGLAKLCHQMLFVYTVLLIFVCGFAEILAMRPLTEGDDHNEQWTMMKKTSPLILQAIPKGQGPPPRENPCTFIPGRRSGRCTHTLGPMNIAGSGASPAFPDHILSFAAANSVADGTDSQKRPLLYR